MPYALKNLDALYAAIWSDVKCEDSAAGQVLALRFDRVFRPLRVYGALAGLRDNRHSKDCECDAKNKETLHRPNENSAPKMGLSREMPDFWV